MLKTALLEATGLHQAVNDSAQEAYAALAAEGYSPADVHKIAVCYDVTERIVESLVSRGFKAEHEIRIGEDVVEHSYVALETASGAEVVADSTWQQLLPHDKRTAELAKLLIGSRGQIIEEARSFGVPETALGIWRAGGYRMSVAEMRRRNDEAAAAADTVEADKWMAFAQN